MANPIILWETMTPEDQQRLSIPNANIIANMHACYEGHTTPVETSLFDTVRYASAGAGTNAFYPGIENMKKICAENDLTESCRNVRNNKLQHHLSRLDVDKNKTLILDIPIQVMEFLQQANANPTIETKCEELKKQMSTFLTNLSREITKYHPKMIDSYIKNFGNFFNEEKRDLLQHTNRLMSNYEKYTNNKNQRIRFEKTIYFRVVYKFAETMRFEYTNTIENIKKRLQNHYKTPIGMPKQQMFGRQSDDVHTDIGIAIKIIDNSFLDTLSKFYCEENGLDHAEFKTSVSQYPDGVYLRINNHLYRFFRWCFEEILGEDEPIEILNKMSLDYHLLPAQQTYKADDVLSTEDLIEFSKYMKIVIFMAFKIPVQYRKNIKFNYLSLGCNDLDTDSDARMEQYELQSSPEMLGGTRKKKNRKRKTRKHRKL